MANTKQEERTIPDNTDPLAERIFDAAMHLANLMVEAPGSKDMTPAELHRSVLGGLETVYRYGSAGDTEALSGAVRIITDLRYRLPV